MECRVLTSQPTPVRVCGEKSLCRNIWILCRQWRFQHSGSARAFDYALYCRTRACMLCMFVPPPTSLIKVVNSGFFHWVLSVLIYFRFMSAFRVQSAGDVNKKISFVATVLSNTFARSLLGLIHWSPSCPLQLSIFQFNSYQTECFFETMGLHRTMVPNLFWCIPPFAHFGTVNSSPCSSS